jgi:hypothetical protein
MLPTCYLQSGGQERPGSWDPNEVRKPGMHQELSCKWNNMISSEVATGEEGKREQEGWRTWGWRNG